VGFGGPRTMKVRCEALKVRSRGSDEGSPAATCFKLGSVLAADGAHTLLI
jgi:hypothetical protein